MKLLAKLISVFSATSLLVLNFMENSVGGNGSNWICQGDDC